jgi:hypothetical protein
MEAVGLCKSVDVALPRLPHLVGHVLFVSAGPEVVGVDAAGSIAVMTNEQTIRHRPIAQLVGDSMGSTDATIGADDAVPLRVLGPRPEPTVTRRLRIGEKSVNFHINSSTG